MKAYVELIQRKERDIGCDVLTHQKVWFKLKFPCVACADFAILVVWRRAYRSIAHDGHRRRFFHCGYGKGRHRGAVYHPIAGRGQEQALELFS